MGRGEVSIGNPGRDISVGENTRISKPLVMLLAVACGVIVASNYYAQPLLPDLRASFRVSPEIVGLCMTLNQLGYAVGLVFLVPLGDLVRRRRLVVAMLSLNAAALAAAAAASGVWMLVALLACVGITGTVINILIPTGATLAGEEQRGKVVGTLMTGLLLGIMLARTVAGALDQVAGWRFVYGLAAFLVVVLAVLLHRGLPDLPGSHGTDYRRLMASVIAMVASEPFLRRRMAIGALGFGIFQLLWTALPFLLSARPYDYPAAVIGLFGLIGAAGALAARPVGHMQDRGRAHLASGALLAVIGLAWALLAHGSSLVAVIAGILILDVGVQGVHVLNQARIYGYVPKIRSRVTTAYMTAYFLGGAGGSGLAAMLYPRWGWEGISVAGGALTVLALVLWGTERVRYPSNAFAGNTGEPEHTVEKRS
jgi:predicted MFS family arabinose efflux permease